jgi:hypothetical protein
MNTKNISEIINQYAFVRTEKDRNDETFIENRLREHNLVSRQRAAVSFCKKLTGLTNIPNITKLTNEDKDSIENCLRDNFLAKDQSYFGKRDHIYLDIYD